MKQCQVNVICFYFSSTKFHKNFVYSVVAVPVNGLFSRTTWVSRHQKGKPFWILMKQEMMGGNGIS